MKKNIWYLDNTNDIVSMSTNEKDLSDMINLLRYYFIIKKLQHNIGQNKIMVQEETR